VAAVTSVRDKVVDAHQRLRVGPCYRHGALCHRCGQVGVHELPALFGASSFSSDPGTNFELLASHYIPASGLPYDLCCATAELFYLSHPQKGSWLRAATRSVDRHPELHRPTPSRIQAACSIPSNHGTCPELAADVGVSLLLERWDKAFTGVMNTLIRCNFLWHW